MRVKKSLWFVGVVLVLLWSMNCSGKQGVGGPCSSNDQCSDGLVCQGGQCAQISSESTGEGGNDKEAVTGETAQESVSPEVAKESGAESGVESGSESGPEPGPEPGPESVKEETSNDDGGVSSPDSSEGLVQEKAPTERKPEAVVESNPNPESTTQEALPDNTSCPATCKQSSDCSQCLNQRTSCLTIPGSTTGFCTRPQSVCPMTCSSNADCSKCEAGRTQCIGLSGIKACAAGGGCPATCSSDADCKQCPYRPTCTQLLGTLAICTPTPPPPPKCPATCTQDSDCAPCGASQKQCITGSSGTKVCGTKSTGTCPAKCSSNSDCSSCANGRTSCVSFPGVGSFCAQPTNICPLTCSSNNDCGSCTSDRQTCIQVITGISACFAGGTCKGFCTTNSDCSGCLGRPNCNNVLGVNVCTP